MDDDLRDLLDPDDDPRVAAALAAVRDELLRDPDELTARRHLRAVRCGRGSAYGGRGPSYLRRTAAAAAVAVLASGAALTSVSTPVVPSAPAGDPTAPPAPAPDFEIPPASIPSLAPTPPPPVGPRAASSRPDAPDGDRAAVPADPEPVPDDASPPDPRHQHAPTRPAVEVPADPERPDIAPEDRGTDAPPERRSDGPEDPPVDTPQGGEGDGHPPIGSSAHQPTGPAGDAPHRAEAQRAGDAHVGPPATPPGGSRR